jgi:hypothetical protein
VLRPSIAENARFFSLAIPLIVGPQWALTFAERRYEPYEHVGWAWRLLLSLPLAFLMCVFRRDPGADSGGTRALIPL